MTNRLVYVELKSGHSGNGPAWIDIATTSKSGATIYSNGKAFKSLKGSGTGSNYFDIQTGDEYWISGIKKNNQDRHWAGGGAIAIDHAAIEAYLSETGQSSLPRNLIPSDLEPSKQQRQHRELENRSLSERDEAMIDTPPNSRRDMIKLKV